MNTKVYVNTPLEPSEHEKLAALAKKNSRSKGMQLRLLAVAALSQSKPRQKKGSSSQ